MIGVTDCSSVAELVALLIVLLSNEIRASFRARQADRDRAALALERDRAHRGPGP